MLWILLAVVLAIPAWLGISRPGTETQARRWVGRCLVWGIAIGAALSGMMWLGSIHVPTSANLLWGPLLGASGGAFCGLVTAAVWLVSARLGKRGSNSPTV